LPDFSWYKHTKTEKMYQISTKCTKSEQNIRNGRKIDLMSKNIPKSSFESSSKMYPNFNFWFENIFGNLAILGLDDSLKLGARGIFFSQEFSKLHLHLKSVLRLIDPFLRCTRFSIEGRRGQSYKIFIPFVRVLAHTWLPAARVYLRQLGPGLPDFSWYNKSKLGKYTK
jgi:hypothetical protein